MNRDILQKLNHWKSADGRKPLILKGVRQVGKTYILKQFGAEAFSQVFYINFEKQPHFSGLFEDDLNPERIITEISFAFKKQINIEQDILILDEIQSCPKALNSLKYFCEDLPVLAVCAAGSLLGLHLSDESFPVGKVNRLEMHPMSFKEFLMAQDENMLVNLLDSIELNSNIPSIAHGQLWEQLKNYFIVGGLPEVVLQFVKHKAELFTAFNMVRQTQNDIIRDYYADIAKHAGKVNAMHIDRIWQSVPNQLMKNQDSSTNKFKFKGVIPGVNRYRQLANTIDWLLNAGLLIKVNIVNTCKQPLSAYANENAFKLFMFDVGILGALSGLSPETILKYDYGSYKGYFAENFVCQELVFMDNQLLYNWQEKTAEVEFLKNINGEIIPIEVKSGTVTHAKSLKVFADKYQSAYRLILSAKAKSINAKNKTYHLPLYLTAQIYRILEF